MLPSTDQCKEYGLRVEIEENFFVVQNIRCRRSEVEQIFREMGYQPIVSTNRRNGKLLITVKPFEKTEEFDLKTVERVVLTAEKIRSLIASIPIFASVDPETRFKSPQVGWKTLQEIKEDAIRIATCPAPYLIDYLDSSVEPGRFLDLGCGRLANTQLLLDAGWSGVAIDSAPVILEKPLVNVVAYHLEDRLDVCIDNVLTADFGKAPYDLIIAQDLLPYLSPTDLEPFLRKIQASLSDDGQFIGSLFFEDQPDNPRATFFKQSIGGYLYPDQRMLYSLLENCGFEVIHCVLNNEHSPSKIMDVVHFSAKKARPL